MTARTTVLYVAGEGRSGSTLLDRLLGQVPGVVAGGELREVWYWGLARNASCGCGEPFRSCPFWTAVGHDAFGGWDRIDPQEAVDLARAVDRLRTVPRLRSRRPRLTDHVRRYLDRQARLYGAIAQAAGARVVVDSSKVPSAAAVLLRVPSIDLRVVHLVRDSRGVAYSWSTPVRRTDVPGEDVYMHRFGPARIALRWIERNEVARSVASAVPSTLVRYEDLVADPAATVARVAELAGVRLAAHDLAFIGQGEASLAPTHSVMGNPSRMSGGVQPIRADERWRASMTPRSRWTVTAITWPWLVRFGYRLSTRAPALSRASS
jgi:hypothetical protein